MVLNCKKMVASERNNRQLLAHVRAYQGALFVETREKEKVIMTIPTLFTIDERLQIPNGFYYSAEFLQSLAAFDLKKAEVEGVMTDGADGSGAAGCGDGGVCGCGGSV